MSVFEEAIAAVDAAMSQGARRHARELWAGLSPAGEQESWQLELRRVLLCSTDEEDLWWRLSIDELRLALMRLADSPHAAPDEAERARVSALQVDLARRRKAAVTASLDALEKGTDATARVIAVRARAHMMFDERDEAREVLEAALANQDSYHLHAAYAQLLFVVADFDNAEHYAHLLEGTPHALDGKDMLVSIAAARGDLAAEHHAISRAIEEAPLSDLLAGRLAHRALVTASLDDLTAARTDLKRALAAALPDQRENVAEYVRHRLDAIDTAGPHTGHRRLEAFPTVLQKWNYCGPAVIELCLRYLGIEMTQDLVAEAVKEEEGTSMLAIVEFLREQGIEARRVEATPERLRAAIDLGIPVILDEDYSNTRHVVVAMGYDDRLGVLLVADPATHAPLRQGIELRDALAGAHRYGGVAVLGRSAEVSDDLRTALDQAGLIEREHIALLDEISRTREDISPAFSERTALEVAGLARAALALEPRFALAAVIEAGSSASATLGADNLVATNLANARVHFPEVAAFAGLAGTWSQRRGNAEVAIAEAVLASRLDPARAQPRVDLALGLTDAGERALAYQYANDAFVRGPAHPQATVALARIVVDELVQRRREAGGLRDVGAAFMWPSEAGTGTRIPIDDDTMTALAAYLTEAAVDMAPDDATGLLARGDFHLGSGRLTEARGAYQSAAERVPSWLTPRVRLAYVLEALGDHAALQMAQQCMAMGVLLPEGWTAVLSLVARLGTEADLLDAAGLALGSGIEARVPLAAVFDAVCGARRSEPEAARTLVKLARGRAADSAVLHGAIDVLERWSLQGHAVELLRQRVVAAPEDAAAHFTLAKVLRLTPAYADEALRHGERALALAPWALEIKTQVGWMVVRSDPERVLQLDAAVHDESLGAHELRRYALVQLGRASEAEALAADRDSSMGGPQRARAAIAMDHLNSSRPERLAQVDAWFTPQWMNADDVLYWLQVQVNAGNAHQAVKLLEHRPDITARPQMAAVIACLGAGVGAELVATACRRTAEFETNPARLVELEVSALLALQEFRGIGAIAGANVVALVRCAVVVPDAAARLEFARKAAVTAPHDRDVLAVLQAALFDNGQPKEAGDVARELYEDYPFYSLGAACVATVEALVGDASAAMKYAQTAVSQAPNSARARAAAAIAAAVTGDWAAAAEHVKAGGRWNTAPTYVVEGAPEALVAAADAGDQGRFEASVASLHRLAPGADVARLEQACRDRLQFLADGAV